MSLPGLSIRKPVMGWMAILALFVFGYISLKGLGISRYPDIDNPYVTVTVNYPGTAPELIESDVTEVIEGALSGVEGIKDMTSSSSFGTSRVTLEFDISKNIDVAIQDVNAVLQGIIRKLPDDIDPPTVRKSNPEDRPILQLALSGDADLRELMFFANNNLHDRLATIEGVADVTLGGFLQPVIRVWLDPQKLAAFELTHDDVITSLQTEHREVPAGRITREKDEISLRFLGEAATVDEIAKLAVTRRSGSLLYRKVTIGQLGRVEAGLEDVRSFARTDGKRSVGLGITKQHGANSVDVAQRVVDRIKSLELPKGYKLEVNWDTTKSIRDSIHELAFTLVLSVALTGLVCWLFLGSIASTLNIVLAIPTSIMGTFIVMHWLGYTLNIFTMLALILSVGIIVDDAIMVLENIFRFREHEKDPATAALKGAEQVQFAALATSAAIIAIFFPIVYVSGITGAYLAQFGIVLCIAVLFSTIEALTFTPMRLAGFKAEDKMRGIPALIDRGVKRAANLYSRWAQRTLGSGWKTSFYYVAALLVFGGSILLINHVPKELLPDEDTGTLSIKAQLPLGTSLEETARRTEQLEKLVLDTPGVQRLYTVIGGYGGDVNTASLMVTLADRDKRKLSQAEIQNKLRGKFRALGSDFRARIQSAGGTSLGGKHGFPVDLTLKSPKWDDLVAGSKKLEDALEASGKLVDVDTSFDNGSPELSIRPRREAARLHGVSAGDISETIAFMFNGVTAAKFNDEGRRVDIVVKADPAKTPTSVDGLKSLYVRNNRGQLIPLSTLVTFEKSSAPVTITRDNRERSISVYGNLAKGVYQGEAIEFARKLAAQVLPSDVRVDTSAKTGDLSTTFKDLIVALGLGVLVAYMILGSQFNSYIHPVTILLALPFSVTGAFVALYLGHSTLNLFSMIGLLLLMGIVKKNSIMLVEFANQEREKGKSSLEAMVASCRTRFRPILMTSFTTMAAAVPPALKIGTSNESSASMSIGVIGGILFSTLMTYFVVPLAYVHFSRFEKKKQHQAPQHHDKAAPEEASRLSV
jgi:HAE1 family hydrophobic/amphiphilic exporter-1